MLFASRFMFYPDRGHTVLLLLSLLSYLTGVLFATEDFCDPNPCANGGTCVRPMHKAARLLNPDGSPHSTYQCICPNGWGGPNCTEDLNDCIDQPCLNGGVCENQLNMRYVCHCGEDFVGQNCEYTNPCKANPCENGGSCQADVLGRFTCECPRWYQGERCELELDPCHRVNPCQGPQSKCHLVRDNQQNTVDGIGRLIDFRCECGPGYKGRYCEKHEDPCAHVNCTNGGRCFYLGNQTTCICPPGFGGSTCELRQDMHQDTSNQQARIVNSKINLSPDMISGSDICEQAGCTLNSQTGDRICRADCVLKGCLGLEELKDCPYWQACLAASVTQSATSIQESCLGRFRNGHCDVECNVPECYYDGMDCLGSRPTCVNKEFCIKHYGDGVCQPQCAESVCGFDGGDCLHVSPSSDAQITPSWIPSSTLSPSISPSTMPVPSSVPAAFGEPLLFLAVLNTTTKEFNHKRSSFLSTIGMMVRGVAQVWRNNRTNSELLQDLPTSRDMKLVLAIWLCPSVQNLSECNNPLIRRTPRAVGDFIRSTVTLDSTPQPVAMKSFAPLEDSGQLDFNYVTDPQWSRFLRSKEAIAIYICLCILAGIIVILVIFLVLQRDPWHKPSKRVFTAGVWCPPVAVGLKQELRPVNRVSNCIGPTARDSSTSNKQHHSLLSSYARDISGVELPDKCGPSFLAGQSAQTPESGVSGDSFEKPPKPTENRLKRKFFESEYLMPSESHAERMQPPSKSLCTNHKPVLANNYTGYAPRLKDSNGHGLVKEEFLRPLLDPTTTQNHYPDSSLVMHNQLSEILRSQDGLHPLTVHEAGSIRELLQSDEGDLQKCAETSTFSHHFVPRIDSASYDYNGTPQPDTRKTPKLLCLKTDCGSSCAPQESILHLAGRMNSGRDFVLSLQQNLKSDQLSHAVSMVDDTGRSALATAAAANAIETVGALYQLEKEVLAANRAQGAIKPHDITPANTTKSRRRQKQSEPRQTTALIAAVRAGNDEVVRCLIDEGCPLTGVDEFGRNAIHWAAATNSISLLQRLVQCKGFYRLVNARDDLDRTPLMLATREGFEQAVQFLLEHKAGVLVADCIENDPIAIARMKGFKSIENLLLKYHNPETCSTGLAERCLQDTYHGSPFDKVTDSPSETSEFDTQSMGADSDEPEQPGGISPTKQLPKEWHSMNIDNAAGFRCNSDSLNTPLGKRGQFVRLVNPTVDQSQLSVERSKHPSNK